MVVEVEESGGSGAVVEHCEDEGQESAQMSAEEEQEEEEEEAPVQLPATAPILSASAEPEVQKKGEALLPMLFHTLECRSLGSGTPV